MREVRRLLEDRNTLMGGVILVSALIFAGGTGKRMSTRAKPKQFLELHGKPVIVYTIEHFEAHPEIDNIVVVCLASWIAEMKFLIKQHRFSKVTQVIPGGDGGDRSIYNGLLALSDKCVDDDIVLIHDGVRPLVTEELITANIEVAKTYKTAITVESVSESVVAVDENGVIVSVPPRKEMYSAKAPQTFKFGLIWELYQKAYGESRRSIDSAHLCSIYNVEMHTVISTPHNIKITAPQDYYIFRALYEATENAQFLGFKI